MKVLHVISGIDPQFGGPTSALLGLAEAQMDAGLHVGIACTYYGEEPKLPALDRLRKSGAGVRLLGPAAGPLHRHPAIVPALLQAIEGAAIVHVHALWDEMQHRAAQSARRMQVPYLVRPCGMLAPWCLSQSWLKKKLYFIWRLRRNLDLAAAIHFTSDGEREQTAPLKLRPPAIVEPNGIDLREFEPLPPRGDFRKRHALLGDKPVVIFLGRLHPKKGLDLLIPAFARARTDDAVLVLAGPEENGYRGTVERMVSEHGLQKRVLFTGMLHGADRIAALADADLFVLPSYQENFGISVIEALAAGLPVIVSDKVNIHTEIQAAGVGAVVPTQVEPLAEALTLWLRDASLRRGAAEKARLFVWGRYDWREIARRWIGHYERLSARTKECVAR